MVSVSVGLNELDKFLSGLEVGDTGTVFVVDRRDELVAAQYRRCGLGGYRSHTDDHHGQESDSARMRWRFS